MAKIEEYIKKFKNGVNKYNPVEMAAFAAFVDKEEKPFQMEEEIEKDGFFLRKTIHEYKNISKKYRITFGKSYSWSCDHFIGDKPVVSTWEKDWDD